MWQLKATVHKVLSTLIASNSFWSKYRTTVVPSLLVVNPVVKVTEENGLMASDCNTTPINCKDEILTVSENLRVIDPLFKLNVSNVLS